MFAAICVIVGGFLFHLNPMEWIAILLAIGFVFTTEIINSAIEHLADFVSHDKHNKIKKVKDLAAAGVLVSVICSATIGLLIFLPKLYALFG